MSNDVPLRQAFTAELVARGAVKDPRWIAAFRDVPRHAFAHAFFIHDVETDTRTQISEADGEVWLRAVYSDTPLLTQVDLGATATSASSQPSLMGRMLEALRVCDTSSVLEIGTGTGYNAALLTHGLGPAQVTSVEVDGELAAAATAALDQAGYQPTVVAGDGREGFQPRAPYDRILATCGVTRIPPAWVEQLAEGGVLVVSVGFGLARLRRRGDMLAGSFLPGFAAFMGARSPGEVRFSHRDAMALCEGEGEARRERVPEDVNDPDLRAFARFFLPELVRFSRSGEGGLVEHGAVDPTTRSWALASNRGIVTEFGPRRLWAELAECYGRWVSAGRPGPGRLGLRVRIDGEHTLIAPGVGQEWRLASLVALS